MKKIEDFGNLTITAYVKFKAQSITINNLSPKKKKKKEKRKKDKQNTFIQTIFNPNASIKTKQIHKHK